VRTYYRGPDAAVTDELLIWQAGGTRSFVVAELHDLGLVRQQGTRLWHVVAGVLLAAGGGVWVQLALPARWPVGITALVLALAVALWPPRVRGWTLRGRYRGAQGVELYSSTDLRVFNQVTRALRRSIEDSRPGR
jgi:uncharacterized protein DUF6232